MNAGPRRGHKTCGQLGPGKKVQMGVRREQIAQASAAMRPTAKVVLPAPLAGTAMRQRGTFMQALIAASLRMEEARQRGDAFDHARGGARAVAVRLERVHPPGLRRRDLAPHRRFGQGFPFRLRLFA